MRIDKSERKRAERVSAAVDGLIQGPGTLLPELRPADQPALDAARQLARLPALLGPVDAELERRVLQCPARAARQIGEEARQTHRRLVLPWAVAGLATLLLALALFTPFGQTAAAGFRAVFRLGRTEVRVTPADLTAAPLATAQIRATAIAQSLSLAEAPHKVPFALLLPAYLPPGYTFQSLTGYTYPDLPAWVPQPFSVEILYGDGQGHQVSLRLYPITLGDKDRLNTSALNLEAAPIQEVRPVDVAGRPAVLLLLATEAEKTAWRELVWEQGNLILSLSSSDASEEDLMSMARSVQ